MPSYKNPVHYIIHVVQKEGAIRTSTHIAVEGKEAVVVDLVIGDRGYIAYKTSEDGNYSLWNNGLLWNRLYTSSVQKVDVSDDGVLTIETNNSYYILTPTEDRP